jgi:DnaK suppressor protein
MMKKTNVSTNGLEKYRKVLLGKKSELFSGSRGLLGILAGPGPSSPEDLAPVFHDQYFALRINDLDRLQLKLIDAALDRMDSHGYGVCVDCGEAISGRRLEAIPWAVRCIDCEELFSADSEIRPSGRSIEPDGLAA